MYLGVGCGGICSPLSYSRPPLNFQIHPPPFDMVEVNLAEIKFAGAIGDRQTAKLNPPPNFPAIRYSHYIRCSVAYGPLTLCEANLTEDAMFQWTTLSYNNFMDIYTNTT